MDNRSGAGTHASMAFEPDAANVAAAREFAVSRLQADGLAVPIELELVVSELVTNGFVHARTDVEVVIETDEDAVLVEVRDGSADVPFARHPEAWEVSGRGLALIDAICERWGVRETTHGKIVWARLSIAPHRGGS